MSLIGCIADDLTGATDVAVTMCGRGVATALSVGIPRCPLPARTAGLVIALKSRSCPVDEALSMSREALSALRAWGARRILFKICSTFDSTPAGNIGPVADQLAAELKAGIVPVTPAYPGNRRTVYQGHLFVADTLLSESSMKDHPVTPMRDPDLRRVLAAQSARQVGLVDLTTVRHGAPAVVSRLDMLESGGFGYAIVDAVCDRDLEILAAATAKRPLLVGGAGLGGAMAATIRPAAAARAIAAVDLSQPAVALAGSCSKTTLQQIATARDAGMPALRLTPAAIRDGSAIDEACRFALDHRGPRGVLIYSSADETDRAAMDSADIGEAIEQSFGAIAHQLAQAGVRRFIVAGGETSGAVVQGLGLEAMLVGPEIDTGVPWMRDAGTSGLVLALKSGNFGTSDFLLKASACK